MVRFFFKIFAFLSKSFFKPTKNVEKNNENLLYIGQVMVWINFLIDELQKIKNKLLICSDLSQTNKQKAMQNQENTSLSNDNMSKIFTNEKENVEKIIEEHSQPAENFDEED